MSNEHPRRLFRRRNLLWLAVFLLLPFILPWSRVNCRTEEIDIRSGQIRYTRLLYWVPVSRRIEPSSVSDAVGSSAAKPDWQRVNTFSPGISYSPHHGYHGAIAQLHVLSMLWDFGQFTPAARRESATRLLGAWQQGRGYHAARSYLDALSELTSRRSNEQPQQPIDVRDLPESTGNG